MSREIRILALVAAGLAAARALVLAVDAMGVAWRRRHLYR